MLMCIIVTIFGIMMGSFYACIGYRIPNKISIVKPGSHCVHCKKKLKWYMNIPLLSFLFLGGKCAYCKKEISLLYPCIELVTGILFLLAYIVFCPAGITPKFIIVLILTSIFIITIVSDFLYYYISDRVLLSGLILLVINSLIFLGWKATLYSLLYGAIMFIIVYIIKLIGDRVFKKESLGGGDIKLMGIVGFVLGIVPSLFTILIASMIALPFAIITLKYKKEGIVPFGPFLLGGALLILYFNNEFQTLLKALGLL